MRTKKTQLKPAPPPTPAFPEYYKTAEVARICRVDDSTVRSWRLRRTGPVGWFKMGRALVIRTERVHEWLAAQEAAGLQDVAS